MDSSIFCFATDLADEGVDAVLGNVQERGGLGGVTVAASYHEGRDLFPHNRVRRIRFLESGAVFFAPRALRIESVEKLPDLFESLVKEADAATKQIRSKTERAQALASALAPGRGLPPSGS